MCKDKKKEWNGKTSRDRSNKARFDTGYAGINWSKKRKKRSTFVQYTCPTCGMPDGFHIGTDGFYVDVDVTDHETQQTIKTKVDKCFFCTEYTPISSDEKDYWPMKKWRKPSNS